MSQFLKLLKRWAPPVAVKIGGALPLLLASGAVLLMIAIWWLGPQWTWRQQQPLESLASRSVVSLLIVLLPLLCWSMVLRARFRRLQAEQRESADADADPCLGYIRAQEHRLHQSLTAYLSRTKGPKALYRSPWYLVLGAEGAGKSTFIEQSTPHFSRMRLTRPPSRLHSTGEAAYPVEWWVSNGAVIIEPPGGFIGLAAEGRTGRGPHDAPAADSPASTEARLWAHLLDWLVSVRSRRALDGLLLVIDLPTVVQGSRDQRMALARTLRACLHDVSRHLETRLPVYVVLSKLDLLDGFDQFFERLTASERDQILGVTFELDSRDTFHAWTEAFTDHYDQLIQTLYERLLERLSLSNPCDERARLVALHAQLTGLRQVLQRFLHEVLANDPHIPPAWVRGVYWSSVQRRGELSNAFLREAAQSYNVQMPMRENKPHGKSLVYFSPQIFQRVIVPEAGLASDNPKVARHRRQLLWASSGVGLLVFSLVVATWHRYFDLNQTKTTSVLAKSREYSQQEIDPHVDPTGRNLLEPLDRIRDAAAVFADYRGAWPLVADFGLYQGRSIGPRVDEAYLTLLSGRFLPALAGGVVEAMHAAPAGSERQMAALRVYRMIEDRGNRRPGWVEDWMAQHWQEAFPGQGAVQRNLMEHLRYALAYADADLSQHRERVSEIQNALRGVPLAQRVYASLKQQADERLHGGVDIRHQVGPAFELVYQPADQPQGDDRVWLAPLVTAKGFKAYFEPHRQRLADMGMIDQWALGEREQLDYSDADREALTEQVRTLYSADYIDSWRRALNAFAVTDFQDLNHGVSVLEQFTGPAAPLHRLLETVRENTSFPAGPAVGQAVEVPALAKDPQGMPDQQTTDIRRAFAGLNRMLDAREERPSYYDETLGAITAMYDYAKAVQGSPDPGKAALHAVLRRFSMTEHDPIGTLQRVATGLPEPLRQQVSKLADQTAQVLNVEALRELERRWDAEVYSFFQQRLAGRYPFAVSAPDASLDDFEAFFGPKGRLQQFQDQYLKIFLKDNLDALHSARHGGSLIRQEVIEQLALADRIRETFFDQRGNLSVQFSIEPLGLSANQRTSLLDLDGQLISYAHGHRQITGVVWPNTLGQQVRSNLTLLRLNGNSSSLDYRGPWSMFRLLSRGALNGRTATSVDLSFRTGDGVMRYRLNAEKALNPITQQPFKDFKLPRALLQPAKPLDMQAVTEHLSPRRVDG